MTVRHTRTIKALNGKFMKKKFSIKRRLKRLKLYVSALYFAIKDPRTPWYARVFGILTVAYALSPVDLIPDFIPVLGYLDDVIILPACIYAVMKMIPKPVLKESLARAGKNKINTKAGMAAAVIIGIIWIIVLYCTVRLVLAVIKN
ncbi:MAG: hypothetical protein BWY84_00947 [Candidatus Aerophobetes bacterium ADurb.Bin490]|nr:MAG: hypothetical protein BWY84_00947 [Candidatus Aerophobetes bacterium ADurb.Bin490]